MGSRGGSGEKDLRAIMQFVLIALVILPVLPDRTMGPYGVLNPYQIWWMVVLIVGLSLAGYVAYKLFGARAGRCSRASSAGSSRARPRRPASPGAAERTRESPGSRPWSS